MMFAILTLFTALSLAAVAGWFSIVGFMTIYAGAPLYALVMGIVMECAKLVTVSWIYRNWAYASWGLKLPLMYFVIALMSVSSIGVYGLLSKSHLEQGAGTINNSAKVETLSYQINREKALIADNEKVINQLDTTVNSFLGKDRIDKSLSVRKSQAPQRQQLREDSSAAQKRIDALNDEKFKLESEVRKTELDVGPIRYIAELFYGATDNTTKNIETAVRIFTLLIVSCLDPLAVVLLTAANHTLSRMHNEKKETVPSPEPPRKTGYSYFPPDETASNENINELNEEVSGIHPDVPAPITQNTEIPCPVLPGDTHITYAEETTNQAENTSSAPGIINPVPPLTAPEKLDIIDRTESKQAILSGPHPPNKEIYIEQKSVTVPYYIDNVSNLPAIELRREIPTPMEKLQESTIDKYVIVRGWLKEFKRT